MPKDIDAGIPLDKRFAGVTGADSDAEHLKKLAARPFPSIAPDVKISPQGQRPAIFIK